jgi:hypothetical protein
MYWCQIEGICVADLTQCYFPGAIGPTDWESCTVNPLVSKTPTCRFVHVVYHLYLVVLFPSSSCSYQGNFSNAPSFGRTKWCSKASGVKPLDDLGVCVSDSSPCPVGFTHGSSPPRCLYPDLPSPFFNCFSCVANGYNWITNVSSDAFSPPNMGVCMPSSANLSLACPTCGSLFISSIYQELWQCPASQLASCATCTFSNFVWCGSESRCANSIGYCRDKKSGISSPANCVTSSPSASFPTCSACLLQNGPLVTQRISQWCPKRVCCGSNITGNTSSHASNFVVRGNFTAFHQ